MKIIIAIDSFKGSLTTMQAGNAASVGIRRVYPDAEMIARMDADLRYFAELTKAYDPDADPDYAGAGAAGGLDSG